MDSHSVIDECGICFQDYDLTEHAPVTLQQCNHAYGKSCVDQLLNYKKPCPSCKKPFPKSGLTQYSNNLEIRKKVEYASKFERCSHHPENLLEIYCETEGLKICQNCYNEKHRTHKIQFIRFLIPELSQKAEIYEALDKQCSDIYDAGKKFFENAWSREHSTFRDFELTTTILALESSLKTRALVDEEETKFEDACGRESKMKRYIETQHSQYKDLKTANLSELLKNEPEDLRRNIEEIATQQSLEELQRKIVHSLETGDRPSVNQTDAGKIQIEASNYLPNLKVRSHLSFSLGNGLLEVIAGNILHPETHIDFSILSREVNSISFLFNEFNFNEQDLKLINYIFLRLQNQIHTISIQYHNISGSDLVTRLENHLIDFSRLVFCSPQEFRSIVLIFTKANGSDRFIRCLTDRIKTRPAGLVELHIHCESTDLRGNTLAEFSKVASSCLQNLVKFGFVFKHSKANLGTLSKLGFGLPALKEFIFNNNEDDESKALPIEFLKNTLASMKNLTRCELEIPNSNIEHLNQLLQASGAQSIIIKAPKIQLDQIAIKSKCQSSRMLPKTLTINGYSFDVKDSMPMFRLKTKQNTFKPNIRDYPDLVPYGGNQDQIGGYPFGRLSSQVQQGERDLFGGSGIQDQQYPFGRPLIEDQLDDDVFGSRPSNQAQPESVGIFGLPALGPGIQDQQYPFGRPHIEDQLDDDVFGSRSSNQAQSRGSSLFGGTSNQTQPAGRVFRQGGSGLFGGSNNQARQQGSNIFGNY